MLIVFEGLDGCGKDTQMDLLVKNLELKNLRVAKISNIISRSPTGELIRKVLDPFTAMYVNELQVASLFLSELHNVNKWIDKLYEDNYDVIICGRWFYSTLAYAGYKKEEDFDSILGMCRYTHQPSLTVLLEVSPETSIKRINNRNGKKEVYDSISKQTLIKKAYDKLAPMFPEILKVNGEKSIEHIATEILYRVKLFGIGTDKEKKYSLKESKEFYSFLDVDSNIKLINFFNKHNTNVAKREATMDRIQRYCMLSTKTDTHKDTHAEVIEIDNENLFITILDNDNIVDLARLTYTHLPKRIKLGKERISKSLLQLMTNIKKAHNA